MTLRPRSFKLNNPSPDICFRVSSSRRQYSVTSICRCSSVGNALLKVCNFNSLNMRLLFVFIVSRSSATRFEMPACAVRAIPHSSIFRHTNHVCPTSTTKITQKTRVDHFTAGTRKREPLVGCSFSTTGNSFTHHHRKTRWAPTFCLDFGRVFIPTWSWNISKHPAPWMPRRHGRTLSTRRFSRCPCMIRLPFHSHDLTHGFTSLANVAHRDGGGPNAYSDVRNPTGIRVACPGGITRRILALRIACCPIS